MSSTTWHSCDQVWLSSDSAWAQVGRAPLHVAAQTGNLDSLIRLLDAGAGRAPRDRVSPTEIYTFHTMVASAYMPLAVGSPLLRLLCGS